MDTLLERLEILEKSNVITENAKVICSKVIEQFVNEENASRYSMLITHLAMAVTRIERNETVYSPPDIIMNEVYLSSHFPAAVEKVAMIEKWMNRKLPEEEKKFLYMHFVNVLSQQ
jgi:transcriptional antiterminator